jgi:hypothetical protein
MAWSSLEQVVSPLSGNSYIDSLVDPDRITYNYELPQKGYIDYTFNTASNVANPSLVLQTMSASQQQDVTTALNYISGVTGIAFKQQAGPTADDLVFGMENSSDPSLAGVDYNTYKATEAGSSVSALTLDDTITINANNPLETNPAPGTDGYLTILHEVGHALGLKHPFEGSVVLPASVDNTSYTVMSYDTIQPYATTYGPIDIAALNYLYGGDGLLGKYGLTVNSAGTPVSNLMPGVDSTLAGYPAFNGTFSPSPDIEDDSTSSPPTILGASGTLGTTAPIGMTALDAFVASQQHNGAGSLLAQS